MPAVLLSTLVSMAKQRAGMENSQAVSSSEWEGYVNTAGSYVYRQLVKQYGYDPFEAEKAFTVVADKLQDTGLGTDIDPSSWLALLAVQITTPSGGSRALAKFSQKDRDRKDWSGYTYRSHDVRYRRQGNRIYLEPSTLANGWTGVVRYVPDWVDLSGMAASFDFRISGAPATVALGAALIARAKGRTDNGDLEREFAMRLGDLEASGMLFDRGAAIKQPRRVGW